MSKLSKIANYIVLREQGKTYQEIGEIYGVSKEAVQSAIKNAEKHYGCRVRKENTNIEKIAYKGIYQIFENDRFMTVSKLCRICFNTTNRNTIAKTQHLMEGKNVILTVKNIQNLIAYSDMTFEELFEPRNKGGEQE